MPDYKINDVTLGQPTQVRWILPPVKGVDGTGMKRYGPYHTFELNWNLMNETDFNVLMEIWRGHYNSGTASITVPEYNIIGADWATGFVTYTGTYMDRPEYGNYNNTYHQNVKVTLRRIFIP